MDLKQTFSADGKPVIFPGSPMFKQTLPNKRFFENRKKWVFVDDEGGVYVYDLGNKSVKYRKRGE